MRERLRKAYRKYQNENLKYKKWYWKRNNKRELSSFNQPDLCSTQERILDELNRHGISVFPIEELLDKQLFFDLEAFYNQYLFDHEDKVLASRNEVGKKGVKKSFLFQLADDFKELDITNPMVKVAIQKPLIDVVNSYLGQYSELKYFNIWHTFVSGENAPMRSQLWHRDPEDYLMLKAFVYLSDVDESAGPFTYAKGSHPKGRYRKEAKWYKEEGRNARRSNDTEIRAVVPEKEWITATGKKGTMILADTRGYHKGGHASTKERIMYKNMYLSPKAKFKTHFNNNLSPEELEKVIYCKILGQ
jgi:hypothetical protein